jgi:hypothetical protein
MTNSSSSVSACIRQGRMNCSRLLVPTTAHTPKMFWKKADLNSQSPSFKKVMINGSRKSLVLLRPKKIHSRVMSCKGGLEKEREKTGTLVRVDRADNLIIIIITNNNNVPRGESSSRLWIDPWGTYQPRSRRRCPGVWPTLCRSWSAEIDEMQVSHMCPPRCSDSAARFPETSERYRPTVPNAGGAKKERREEWQSVSGVWHSRSLTTHSN